jgi:DNA helicase II / ATP-dependent DNA helicase PcrA
MDFLDQLNPKQREAVQAPEGAVMVLAGPGSGKTRVLTFRITHLIDALDVAPSQIMAVTFTNKAAREMKERLLPTEAGRQERGLLSPAQVQALTVGTFHSVCARILRREIDAIPGYDRNFVIFDTSDQLAVVRQAMQDLDIDEKVVKARVIHAVISNAKNDLETPEKMLARDYFGEFAQRVYQRYQALLRENNAFDFDDLLMQAVHIFRRRGLLLEAYQTRYRHILVDEFQDTNVAQYELIKLLTGANGSVFVVADEDQSIYGWRGADYRNVRRFRKDYPQHRLILLEENYRSTGNIVEAAMGIIRRNSQRVPKKLFTQRQTGVKVRMVEAYDEKEEAAFVVSEIARLQAREGKPLSDCAVMYRTNAQSRLLEEAFVKRGIPYQLVRGTRFYERKEIKDAIAYLRLIANPHDGVSLDRIINTPPRAIGTKTVSDLKRWAFQMESSMYQALQQLGREADGEEIPLPSPFNSRAQRALLGFLETMDHLIAAKERLPLPELLDLMLGETGYRGYVQDDSREGQDRWDNLMELRRATEQYPDSPAAESMTAFLESVALVSDVDGLTDGRRGPALLTLHAAKGLEFPVVFIVGLNEGVLPLARSIDIIAQNGRKTGEDDEALEEECRLLYVGVTRAEDQLYMVHTFRRSVFGKDEVSRRSRFLDQVPRSVSEHMPATASQSQSGSYRRRGSTAAQDDIKRYTRTVSSRTSTPTPKPRRAPAAGAQYRAGDRVQHATFGEGIVVGVFLDGDDEELDINFRGKGLKRLSVSYAPLQKIE